MTVAETTAGDGLSVAALVEEAAARAGPWPGTVPFVANLERLVRSAESTGALNATGRQVLHKVAVRHLRNLRHLHAHLQRHPEGRPPERAIVVTGLPRTGTTLLHNLLALDPDHRVLRLWEALRPVGPAAGGPSAEALEAQAQRWLDAFHRTVPGFRAIHGATATGPEECDALLQNTFASQHFDDMFDAPDYSAWLAAAPLAAEYRHYALQLGVLAGTSSPGAASAGAASAGTVSPGAASAGAVSAGAASPGARWALKSPSHLGHLDALLGALPGCTVVLCHRHPRQAVASYASLVHTLRRAYSDRASPAVAGRHALTRAAEAMARALAVRDATRGAAFVDVSYATLVRDPVGAVHALYARLGRRVAPGVEERIRGWVAANPQHKHGPHRYDLAGFGLDPGGVDAAFASYLDRFGPLAPA